MGSVRMRLAALLLLAEAAGGMRGAAAADRYVARRGRDRVVGGVPNACLDPGVPCKSLARVLAVAAAGDVVNVAGGTYGGGLLIDASTTLTFLGGWDAAFASRNPGTYPTVLRGRIRRTPIGPDRRVFTIVAGEGETITVTLEGFVLTRGRAMRVIDVFDTFATAQDGGGGLAALAGRLGSVVLTVRDSVIVDNRSALHSGGGVFLGASGGSSSLVATLERVLVVDNYADYAAGIELLGCGNPSCQASLTVTNCVLADNEAEGGAAIHALSGGVTLDVVNTTITANHGFAEHYDDPEGAMVVGSGATATLTNTILWGNSLTPPAPGADLLLGPWAVVNLDHSDVGSIDPGPGVVNDLGGNLDVDPGLVGVTLAPGSPLIDAGTCTGAPAADIEGDTRPSGAGCDIGADEHVP